MSFRVLVVPEDFTKDQYILKPVVSRLVQSATGRGASKVTVCQDPRLAGIGQTLDSGRISKIIERYRSRFDVFIHCVDGNASIDERQVAQGHVIQAVRDTDLLTPSQEIFGVVAARELEVWALAGSNDYVPTDSWQDVRRDPDSKEVRFLPYVEERGIITELAQGRKVLGQEAGGNYRRLKMICAELDDLESEISAWYRNRP